jgi:hypothetical protein
VADAHFDDLTRALRLPSRRGVLAMLGTALLGALLGSDRETARATRRTRHPATSEHRARPHRARPHHAQTRHNGPPGRTERQDGPPAAGPAGTTDTAGKAGACKKRCAECATCEKGKCKKKGGKRRCQPAKCQAQKDGTSCAGGTCRDGACLPNPSPDPPPDPPSACVGQCASTMGCGADGCGGSCGRCAANATCQGGRCVCTPSCGGKACGDDGCGGSCGGCPAPEQCLAGTCGCVPQCAGKECGADGCTGVCGSGTCPAMTCGVGTCSPSGRCAYTMTPGCCTADAQCTTKNPCTTDSCDLHTNTCVQVPVGRGKSCSQPTGSDGVCDGTGHCMACLDDGDCDDGNACAANACRDGVCQSSPEASGTSCPRSGGAGFCDGAGGCVPCLSDAQCDDGNPCHIPRCEPTSHTCAFAMAANYSSCGGSNTCLHGDCRTCTPATGGCQVHEQCCDYHAGTGGCDPFGGVCCRNNGEVCQTNATCCSHVCYRTEGGSAGFGTCIGSVCRDNGLTCRFNVECCSNNCHTATSLCRPPGA